MTILPRPQNPDDTPLLGWLTLFLLVLCLSAPRPQAQALPEVPTGYLAPPLPAIEQRR